MSITSQFLVSIAIVVTLTGCSVEDEQVSARDQAIELLNNGDYERAAGMLEPLHQEDPSNDEIVVLLASAYGGLANLDFVTLFDRMRPYFLETTTESFNLDIAAEDSQDASPEDFHKENLEEIEVALQQFLGRTHEHAKLLFSTPYVSKTDRQYLRKATDLLRSLDDASPRFTQGKLYSATVNLLIFASIMREATSQTTGTTSISFFDLACSLDPEEFFLRLPMASSYLTEVFDDINAIAHVQNVQVTEALGKLEHQIKTINHTYEKYKGISINTSIWIDSLQATHCGP